MCLTPLPAYADELEDQANQVLTQIHELNTKINELSVEYEDALTAQEEIQKQMDTLQEELEIKNAEIALLQEELGTTVARTYRNGHISLLDVFLKAESFESFSTNWNYYNRINEQEAELIQETKDLRQEIEEEQEQYAELEREAEIRIAEAARSKEEAQLLLDEAQATYDSLSVELEKVVVAAEQKQTEIRKEQELQKIQEEQVATGNTVVDRAYGELGKPYVWGAVGPYSYDCSGLVSYCISGQYTRLGTTSTFMGWSRVLDPIPGDICTNDHHCGIYIGGGQMIHAPQSGDVVKIGPVQSGMIYVRP